MILLHTYRDLLPKTAPSCPIVQVLSIPESIKFAHNLQVCSSWSLSNHMCFTICLTVVLSLLAIVPSNALQYD